MREIIFRGLRRNGFGWIEGSLLVFEEPVTSRDPKKSIKKTHYIIPTDGEYDIQYDDWRQYEVDPETIGQYTGLKDKNGENIFEGDIMRNPGNVVEFCNDGFCINGDSPLAYWRNTEVIGNIHDNPELLDGLDIALALAYDKTTRKHPSHSCQRGMLCPTCDKALWTQVEIKGVFGTKKITIKEQPNFCKYCGQALLPAYSGV